MAAAESQSATPYGGVLMPKSAAASKARAPPLSAGAANLIVSKDIFCP
jgi:hypothetical protein